MKINIKNNELLKKVISLLCTIMCLVFMSLKIFKFNATSTYKNTVVSIDNGVSLYNFFLIKVYFYLIIM